ncbi:hypothetical protein ACFVYA_13875 [Amycolatopsis sp. NPDC058278]|uniref:deazapurine DNA modification protein DpdA family protein n=1 Tax=Amycolatopsis sp. NPDC058278 TaxID=3346417 RepID=UPI0036D7D171
MKFYLGTHQPAWLARRLGVRLFVSHRRLAGRKTMPRAQGPWALDSGGFTELTIHGRWRTTPDTYVTAVRRYRAEIGRLDWAAPQDWMTEPEILARTGLTVTDHHRRTVDSYLHLRELAPELPFIPVLQGQIIADHQRCADIYERHDVDLAAQRLVGLGSVCRRQASQEVDDIVRALAERGLRRHGFGVKTTGLRRFGDVLASADSMAWSARGRREPGCAPGHRSEANCLPYALAWRRTLIDSLSTSQRVNPTAGAGLYASASQTRHQNEDPSCSAVAVMRWPALTRCMP